MLSYYSSIVLISWMALLSLTTLIHENAHIAGEDKRLLYITYVLIFLSSLSEWLGVHMNADSNAMAERRLIVSESDVSYAMVLMRESIEFFIMSYEKAFEEVQNNKPKIVEITADDVRKAADCIRHGNNQAERHSSDRKR